MAKRKPKPERSATAAELMDQLDITRDTLQRYKRRGLPHTPSKGRGKPAYYDVAEVAAWMQAEGLTGKPGRPKQDATDLDEAKLRKENAMARNWEIRNQQLEGKLLEADWVQSTWAGIAARVRNSMQGVAAQLSPKLVGKDAMDMERMIDAEIRRRLEILSEQGRDEAA